MRYDQEGRRESAINGNGIAHVAALAG